MLSFLTSFSQFNQVRGTEQIYLNIRESYIEDGEDINDYLKEDYSIQNNDDYVTVENDIKYYYLKFHSDLAAMSNVNSINQVLSSSMFVVFPIILSIYTILNGYLDLKYGVFKIKALRQAMYKVILSKLLSILIVSLIALVFLCVSFAVFQLGFQNIIRPDPSINIDYTVISEINFLGRAPIQLLAMFVIIGVNITFFFFLTLVSKSIVAPLFVLLVYNLLIPVLGRFDVKQNLLLLYNEIFYKNSSIFTSLEINQSFSLFNLFVSLMIVAAIILFMSIFTNKKGYLT